jgi:hypothetical protein
MWNINNEPKFPEDAAGVDLMAIMVFNNGFKVVKR